MLGWWLRHDQLLRNSVWWCTGIKNGANWHGYPRVGWTFRPWPSVRINITTLPHAHTRIRGKNWVATVIHDFGYVNHGSSTNYVIDMPNCREQSVWPKTYVCIFPYSHKISTRKLCFNFIRYIKYFAVTSLYIYNFVIIRESLPKNICHEMWGDVSFVWTVHVACFRTRSVESFWPILVILVRPLCISNVIFHTKFVNYYDVLKPCNTKRKSYTKNGNG
jgi:hypothetical protein